MISRNGGATFSLRSSAADMSQPEDDPISSEHILKLFVNKLLRYKAPLLKLSTMEKVAMFE